MRVVQKRQSLFINSKHSLDKNPTFPTDIIASGEKLERDKLTYTPGASADNEKTKQRGQDSIRKNPTPFVALNWKNTQKSNSNEILKKKET